MQKEIKAVYGYHKLCSKCLPWTHACKQTRLVSLINCCNC